MKDQKYANIMIIGKTGVGKSSFLNYLLNSSVSETGKGKPVTQGFYKYEFENINGLPLRIIDSKGLEVEDFAVIKNNIIEYIKKSFSDSDPMNWLHSIFYCINLKQARLQEEEKKFINDICHSISQAVHIVITHCDSLESDNLKEMEKYIKESLPGNISIIKVNSVVTKKRTGEVVQPFGRDEALETIFRVLWSDIATHTSNSYAAELNHRLKKVLSHVRESLDSVSEKLTTWGLIKEFFNEGGIESAMDSALDIYERELDKEYDSLSEKYREILNPLVEFCNNYSNSLGHSLLLTEFYDLIPNKCMDSLTDIDIDEILEHSNLGKKMSEFDNIDDDGFFSMVSMVCKSVSTIFSFNSLFKELAADVMNEFKRRIPSEKDMADQIYNKLMEQLN